MLFWNYAADLAWNLTTRGRWLRNVAWGGHMFFNTGFSWNYVAFRDWIRNIVTVMFDNVLTYLDTH